MNLTNHWARSGHEVAVATVDDIDSDFFKVSTVVRRLTLGGRSPCRPHNIFRSSLERMTRVWEIRRAVFDHRADVVIAMMTEANLALALGNWGFYGTVCIGVEHTYPPNVKSGPIRRQLKKWAYNRLDAVVALTEKSADWLRTNTHARHVEVIPNSVVVPLPAMEPRVALPPGTERSRVVLSAGRLSTEKQYDILIRVFAGLATRIPEWHLIILGDGTERPRLEADVARYGLSHRIHLPGRAGNLTEWYESADMFVLTSMFEGFPTSIAEALAHGVPVVSFDCDTGPRDLIRHNVDGLLVRPNDESGLGEAIFELASDETKRGAFASEAVKVREVLNASEIDGRWLALFNMCQQRRDSRRGWRAN